MLHGTRIASDESAFDFSPTPKVATGEPEGLITVPDAHLLFNGDFQRHGSDLKIVGDEGQSFLIPGYFRGEKNPTLLSPEGAALTGDIVEALAGPRAPGQFAQAGQQASDQPAIGRVEQVAGNATIVRNGVAITANQGDVVRKGDVVQTGGDGMIAVLFADGSTFSLSANARMVLNEFVYQAGGANNSALISLVQGTIGFVAGQVAKTGDMRVDTPVATMGIRGTAVLVEISANDGQTKFSVLVEPDGTTGAYNLYNKSTGALIATVNNSSVGWVVAPAGPLQIVAQQVQKTPGEVQQELNYFQQIFNIFNQGQQNPFDPSQHTTNPQSTKTAGSSQFLVSDTGNSSSTGGNGAIVVTAVTGNGNGNNPNFNLLTNPDYINNPPIAVPDGGQPVSGGVVPVSNSVIEAGVGSGNTPTDGKTTASGDVLNNDSDPDPGDIIVLTSIRAVSPALHGSLVINAGGEYTYTLDNNKLITQRLAQGETATDVFEYTITDAFGATATATLTIVITGTNDQPVIFGEQATIELIEAAEQTGSETPLTADGQFTYFDVDVSDNAHAITVTAAATGATEGLSLGDAELLDLFETEWTQTGVTGTTGEITWDFSAADSLFDYLAEDEDLVLTYTLTLTDDYGATDTQTVTITVTGTNDAPVISQNSVAAGSVTESGHLAVIDEAGPDGGLEPAIELTPEVQTALAGLQDSPENVSAVLETIQEQGSDLATAIAIVWGYLDDIYVSAGPNQTNVNEAFVRLGVEYVKYLQDGGMPLIDVTAKYTADGTDEGSDPDRVQSLHDNLLGNLSTAALTQRFGNDPDLLDDLTDLVLGVDADLLTRPYYSGNETTSDAAVRAWDSDNGYDAPTATGQLFASDVDNGAVLTWSVETAAGTYGTFAIDASTGEWTYKLDDSRPATQALAEGQSATDTFTAIITDEHGATDTILVTINITGTNDAPVIGPTSVVAGSVTESGDLAAIREAGPNGGLELALPTEALTDTLASLLTDPDDVSTVLETVKDTLEVDAATAITTVWDYLDDIYVSAGPNQTNVNEAFVRLGVEYVKYLQAGGMPLIDVTAKYTADGTDEGSDPDRVQSLHDNLLGNLSTVALTQRFGNDPDLLAELTDLVSDVDPALLSRAYYSGNEGASDDNAREWDADQGYVPTAKGQLVASDVDNGASLTWSAGTTAGTYGTFAIDAATGEWTYKLDDSLTATQALAAGETVTEIFTVTVTDEHGATDTIDVTITVDGTSDAVNVVVHTGEGYTIEQLYEQLFNSDVLEPTADSLWLQHSEDGQNLYILVTGANLDWTGEPGQDFELVSGTITGIEIFYDDQRLEPVVSFTGFTIDAGELQSAINVYEDLDTSALDAIFGAYSYDMAGGAGGDTLTGGGQSDMIDGGAGSDILDGAEGSDILTGGLNDDAFVFTPGTGIDTIADFNSSQGDKIYLSDFEGIPSPDDPEAFENWAEHAFEHVNGGTLIHLDGEQGTDRIFVAGVTSLTASDFVVTYGV